MKEVCAVLCLSKGSVLSLPKECFFSISRLFRPLVPCPLQFELRKRRGYQVPEAEWKNQVEDPPLAGSKVQ